jgi:hypothetical protein
MPLSVSVTGKILQVFVSELSRHFQAERRAVVEGHFRALHGVREESLWMEGIVHVQTIPPIIV